jgi:signal transduction histidine kinase
MSKLESNNILVYSQHRTETTLRHSVFSVGKNDNCDYVSSMVELKTQIEGNDYGWLVIDQYQLGDKQLGELINLAISNNICIRLIKCDGTELEDKVNDYNVDNNNIISQTAATLAHEINNPLMTISANAEVLLRDYGYLHEDITGKIRQIIRSVDRIKNVTIRLSNLQSVRIKDTVAGKMIDLGDTAECVEEEDNSGMEKVTK